MGDKEVNLLGVRIDNIDVDGILNYINTVLLNGEKAIISNVNVHALNLSYEIDWFRKFLNSSDIVFCDGFGVILGAKLTRQRLDNRLTPPDWIDDLCQQSLTHHWGIFLLGAEPGIAELAAMTLRLRHPGLVINSHHGFFDHDGEENLNVIKQINNTESRIILVGMGMPLQEKWIIDNYKKIDNSCVFLPVGALFDYIAETIPRGPKFLTAHGFEWFTRLLIEPRRLWKRYLIGNPKFLFRLLKYHF